MAVQNSLSTKPIVNDKSITQVFTFGHPPNQFILTSGERLGPIDVAYETYGQLNGSGDNAILICHALTGSAHAAGGYSETFKSEGWWDSLIGPGKPFDTNRYFIVCSNILGGCYGTTGPASINPAIGQPYGMSFPVVTVRDMVRVQRQLLRYLGVKRLVTVAGGSMGGMQAIEWAVTYPDFMDGVICLAAAGRLYPQAIAFNEVGRRAIMLDPKWNCGNYYPGQGPVDGLALARMIGTITYKSDESMNKRFGRKLCSDDEECLFKFDEKFQVEDYLHYHGGALVKRFDANSYLYLTKAMDLHDISLGYNSYEEALSSIKASMLVVGISSDILFPTYQQKEIVDIMQKHNLEAHYYEIDSPHGHDGFLIEFDKIKPFVDVFLRNL
ncbi:MAG: homoserine O-acetyltransferase [Clostridia bacterium]|nr:homoserine O-acetyltransferase [Clostridia bacterium]